MGFVYKLKPEVRDFILDEKKTNPVISCRGLVSLVHDRFQVKLSKSSINSLFKEAGLSMPVGRRRTKKRRRPSLGTLPLTGQQPIVTETVIPELTPETPPEMPILPELEPVIPEAPEEAKPAEIPIEKAKEPEAPIIEQPASEVEIPVEETKPVEPAPEPAKEPLVIEPVSEPQEPEPPIEPESAPVCEPEPEKIETSPIFDLPVEAEGTGAILLKIADYLLGGVYSINDAIENRIRKTAPDSLSKTEALLYHPLFSATYDNELSTDSGLWQLINYRFSQQELFTYLTELQQYSAVNSDIIRIISTLSQEVRGIKATLSDGTIMYFDGQLHSVWSTPQMPYDFSAPIYNLKAYINEYFQEDEPFVLFTAPGYEQPTREFFDFMLSLEIGEKTISKLLLYGNRFEELEIVNVEQSKKKGFIFGLWPWQFGQFRRVKSMGDFFKWQFNGLNKEFYLAEGQVELTQPNTGQKIALRGCFIKLGLNDKIRIIVLSNLPHDMLKTQELAQKYLNQWPNLDETYQDFSRKIELFTYTAASRRFFSLETLSWNKEAALGLIHLLNRYLSTLDMYVRWHFLPTGYEERDLAFMKDNFYKLKVNFDKSREGLLRAVFKPAPGYPYIRELDYICRRANERGVVIFDNRRLWLSV